MFLALRDLRFAKGRFTLIVTVVALMTLLVGFLTGLSGGLGMQNIAALLNAKSDRVVFSADDGETVGFATSAVTEKQMETWKNGSTAVTPLGISNVLLDSGDKTESVAVFAAPASSIDNAPANNTGITLGETTAHDLGVAKGDPLTLAGAELTVTNVVSDQFYAHRPVAYVTLDAWHAYLKNTRQPATFASVLLVNSARGTTAATDPASLDSSAGTVSESFYPALLKLESFKSEIGSLGMMIGMLALISVLVIGVFFLVWSMQRQRDIAVLKAIGAHTGWLAKDALGQALLVLFLGAAIGTALTVALGLATGQAMPFVMNTLTLAAPPVGMTVAGLLGALVSLRHITKVDPNTALQASAA